MRSPAIEVLTATSIRELEVLAMRAPGLDLALIDTIQAIDLAAVRAFHCACPELPLLALGLREHESEIISHASAGFCSYLDRNEGIDSLCEVVEDALAGKLQCKPEIAAAMMRALFRKAPLPVMQEATTLTRRENQVARLVAQFLSNKEIARQLNLSESTVKHHVHAVLGKFGVSTRSQLMRQMRDDPWDGPRDGEAAARSAGCA